MTIVGWLQIAAVLALVLISARPLGIYMANVFDGKRTFLSPVLGRSSVVFLRYAV